MRTIIIVTREGKIVEFLFRALDGPEIKLINDDKIALIDKEQGLKGFVTKDKLDLGNNETRLTIPRNRPAVSETERQKLDSMLENSQLINVMFLNKRIVKNS